MIAAPASMRMVRPRGGDFVYSAREVEMMEADARIALALGADGIVFGCLAPGADGGLGLDVAALERVCSIAREAAEERGEAVDMTFHMAFDALPERRQLEAIDAIADLGFTRILTHGGAAGTPVEENLDRLRTYVERAAGRLVILPGAGITYENAERVADALGVREVHGTEDRGAVSAVYGVEDAIALLEGKSEPRRFTAVLEQLRLGRVSVCFLDGDLGVLTRLARGGYFATPFCEDGARAMAEMLPAGAVSNICDVAFAPLIAPGVDPAEYELRVYDGTTPIDPGDAKISMRPLSACDFDLVDACYDLLPSDAIPRSYRAGVAPGRLRLPWRPGRLHRGARRGVHGHARGVSRSSPARLRPRARGGAHGRLPAAGTRAILPRRPCERGIEGPAGEVGTQKGRAHAVLGRDSLARRPVAPCSSP